MPETGTKQRRIAAIIASAAVFAVVCPCRPDKWRIEFQVVAFGVVMALMLFADDTKTAIVVTMAFAALAFHWKSQASAPKVSGGETFTVGAPHEMRPDDPGSPTGEDPAILRTAGARVSFGAGSEHPLPDPGMNVEDLKQFTPPELLLAAQSNEVPSRTRSLITDYS
jgi:hypothetical protein